MARGGLKTVSPSIDLPVSAPGPCLARKGNPMRAFAVLLAAGCLVGSFTPRTALADPDEKAIQRAMAQQRKAAEAEMRRQAEYEKKVMEQQQRAMQEQMKAERKSMEMQQKAIQNQQKAMQNQQKAAQNQKN